MRTETHWETNEIILGIDPEDGRNVHGRMDVALSLEEAERLVGLLQESVRYYHHLEDSLPEVLGFE